jgi:predicted nucleic acid-binding protein
MHYLDTSFIVSALMPDEIASAQSRKWLGQDREAPVAVSWWVFTEVASALAMKVRHGLVTVDQRADILTVWTSLRSSFRELAVAAEDFELAARFADRHELGLRAGDALHVAIAAAHGCTLVTLDRTLATAAPQCGVPVAAF